jgi:hypothetical protein
MYPYRNQFPIENFATVVHGKKINARPMLSKQTFHQEI